jgi:hypothetical protein
MPKLSGSEYEFGDIRIDKENVGGLEFKTNIFTNSYFDVVIDRRDGFIFEIVTKPVDVASLKVSSVARRKIFQSLAGFALRLKTLRQRRYKGVSDVNTYLKYHNAQCNKREYRLKTGTGLPRTNGASAYNRLDWRKKIGPLSLSIPDRYKDRVSAFGIQHTIGVRIDKFPSLISSSKIDIARKGRVIRRNIRALAVQRGKEMVKKLNEILGLVGHDQLSRAIGSHMAAHDKCRIRGHFTRIAFEAETLKNKDAAKTTSWAKSAFTILPKTTVMHSYERAFSSFDRAAIRTATAADDGAALIGAILKIIMRRGDEKWGLQGTLTVADYLRISLGIAPVKAKKSDGHPSRWLDGFSTFDASAGKVDLELDNGVFDKRAVELDPEVIVVEVRSVPRLVSDRIDDLDKRLDKLDRLVRLYHPSFRRFRSLSRAAGQAEDG